MHPENPIDPDDELKAENELLKLKLELEHGMTQSDTNLFGPEVENQWLNHIYNFEHKFKNAKRAKVYDLIGRPPFSKLNDLQGTDVSKALENLLGLLYEEGIELDFCCEYKDTVIYKFITEEFFEHEMSDTRMPGTVSHFSYEEFHPNHDYDLRRYASEFVESILSREWNAKFDSYQLSDIIIFSGEHYNSAELSSIILSFQEGCTFELVKFEINEVTFDLAKGSGKVMAFLAYNYNSAQSRGMHDGTAEIMFNYEPTGYWHINGISLPGLNG